MSAREETEFGPARDTQGSIEGINQNSSDTKCVRMARYPVDNTMEISLGNIADAGGGWGGVGTGGEGGLGISGVRGGLGISSNDDI